MKLHSLLTTLVLAMASTSSFAAGSFQRELLVSNSTLLSDGTSASLTFSDSVTVLGIAAGYGHVFTESIEGIVKGQLSSVDTDFGSATTTLILGAGPRINFPLGSTGLNHAAFVGFTLGIADFGGRDDMDLFWELEFGKRFGLGGGFTYSPNLTYGKVSGSEGAFSIVPVAFSYLF